MTSTVTTVILIKLVWNLRKKMCVWIGLLKSREEEILK